MALPRALRLKKTKDIERVFRHSFRLDTEFFIMRIHLKSVNPGRFLIIVPKKVSKKAIVRNLLRRRVQEFVRKRWSLSDKTNDVVLQLKPQILGLTREKLYLELLDVEKRLRL